MPSGTGGELAAILMGVVGAMLFVAAVLYVWTSLALARVFAKLGEDAWTAWVPVLNLIVLFRQGAQNPLWLLTFLVPGVSVVGTVFLILAEHRISQRFGRGVGTTVLAALLFPVWASILGFGSARPDGAGVNPTALPAPTPAALPAPTPAVLPAPAPGPIEAPPTAPTASDSILEATVVVPRRARTWKLETDQGQKVELTGTTVIVGRDPAFPAGVTDAQLVSLTDADRSVSKTHARLDLVDGAWLVTDLHSTNGVKLSASPEFVDGDRLDAGIAAHAEAHLSFGDLSARIRLSS
jgi:pSer/pThr/pTyr-binding forkhead associated (FHA) protein